MNWVSTRGASPPVPFIDALFAGTAPDGGLYMPERLDPLPVGTVESLRGAGVVEIGSRVGAHLLRDEITLDALRPLVAAALDFPIPLVRVTDRVWVLELFHGPTMAFKDVGARVQARLLHHFTDGTPLTILVATSGDTGSAVAQAFHRVPDTRVLVLYPEGQVSDVQEAQMASLGDNVTALAMRGTFDDCQGLVKQAFADARTPEDKVNWQYVQNLGQMSDAQLRHWWRGATPAVRQRVAAEMRAHSRTESGVVRALGARLAKFEDDDRAGSAVAAVRGRTRAEIKRDLLAAKANDPHWAARYTEAMRLFALHDGGWEGESELDKALRELLILELKITKLELIKLGDAAVELKGPSSSVVRARLTDLLTEFDPQGEQYGGLLRTLTIRQRTDSIGDVLQTPLLVDRGRVVRVRDVARVHDTFEDATSYYRINGNPAVSFFISRQANTNAVAVADRVKAHIEKIEPLHPPGVRLILQDDESRSIRQQLSDLRFRALISAGVIFVVLLLGG